MLSEGQAEADRPHGHAGHPQPYLQHREHQEAPNNLAAGAHPSSVIIPSRSERETNHPPSSFHYPPYPFRPLPDPKTFLSSPAKHYPQGLDFQNRRPSSRIGPEAKESLHPLTRSDRNRRIFPGFGGRSPGEESARVEGLSRRSQKPGGARSKEPRSRGAVQSSAASQVSAGNQLPSNLPDSSGSPSFLAEEMNLASRRSKAELLRASLPPPPSSPLLCFRGNTKCFCESFGPQAERADIFSTTLLAVAVSPEKATLSDGLFPSGFLLPRRRPLPPPLSWSDSPSFQ